MRLIWLAWLIAALLAPHVVFSAEAPSFQGKRRSYTVVIPPYPAPVITWHKDKGGVTNISRYQGKVVLLNFWATWCAACLYELPDLDKLAAKIDHDKFVVLAVSLDEPDAGVIKRYLKRLEIKNLPFLYDPLSRSVDAYGIRDGLPWSFLIGRQGKVRGYMKGAAKWMDAEGQNLINYYLDELPNSRP